MTDSQTTINDVINWYSEQLTKMSSGVQDVSCEPYFKPFYEARGVLLTIVMKDADNNVEKDYIDAGGRSYNKTFK